MPAAGLCTSQKYTVVLFQWQLCRFEKVLNLYKFFFVEKRTKTNFDLNNLID